MIEKNNAYIVLSSKNTSYVMQITGAGHIRHLYYGKKICTVHGLEAMTPVRRYVPGNSIAYADNTVSQEDMCLEASTWGMGDYGESFIEVASGLTPLSTDFVYSGMEVLENRCVPENMPFSYSDTPVETLKLTLEDRSHEFILELYYTVYEECDVITRTARFINKSQEKVIIKRFMSNQLDLDSTDYELVTFNGAWAREMEMVTKKCGMGTLVNESRTGTSSSRANPFVMLKAEAASEDIGECYGFNLVYSGNHYESAGVNAFNRLRFQQGINPFMFEATVDSEGHFDVPEAVMTYSYEGTGTMSRNMHNFIRKHIVRGRYRDEERPVLINSWESYYFDVNSKKALNLAKTAADLGIELFVLDDGWFGQRNDETSSLGDWTVNIKKFPDGLMRLSEDIAKNECRFGLWVEPEMVNENSELFKNHPDWILGKKQQALGRNQFILDLTNPEVCSYITEVMSDIFSSARISYVKWDMNRNISDVEEPSLSADNCGEISHRYVLGLYSILDKLTKEYPDILFESCASGGNRFDLGMLCYMPQTWGSDNTDALCRMKMQYSYSYGYPQSVVGAHVSASPNHQTLRSTSLDTRFNVAAMGLLGYELNLGDLGSADKDIIKKHIAFYKKYRAVFQFGDSYRLCSGEHGKYSLMYVSPDKETAVCIYFTREGITNGPLEKIKFKGLDPDAIYKVENLETQLELKDFGGLVNMVSPIHIKQGSIVENVASRFVKFENEKEDVKASGSALMYAGMYLTQRFDGTGYDKGIRVMKDCDSRIYVLTKIRV